MEFALNYQQLIEIDTTPKAAARTWVRLGEGISSVDPSFNDSVDQTTYMKDEGYANSLVIGKQFTMSVSGHRVVGDPAQDFIQTLESALGSDCLSNVRMYDAQGNAKQGACTIASVDFGGGDAGAKTDISFEIHVNGKPTITPKASAGALTAEIAPGTVAKTTKATAMPGLGNTLAYKLTPQTAGTIYANQYISNTVAYTSAANISASVGQYLQLFEVNAYGRVVLFSETLLDAADFPA